MDTSIRPRHNPSRVPSQVGLSLGIYLLLLALPGPAPAPERLDREDVESAIILVNSLDGRRAEGGDVASADLDGGRIRTLAQALREAATDPRDNVIRFDPDLFQEQAGTITLTRTVLIDHAASGHDCLDGSSAATTVTLDVSDCREAGLIVAGQAAFTLRQVVITGGLERNLLVKEEARLVLDRVVLSSSEGPGIACFDKATLRMRQCQLANNRTHGVELHDQSSATLDYVDLRRNGQSGCALFGQSTATISDSYFDGNGDWNTVMTARSRAQLTRCLLRKARFANTDISEQATISFDDCTLDEGERFGLFATGQSEVSMRLTRVSHSGSRGIELQERATIRLQESQVETNGDYGLILFGQSSAELSGTHISGNGAHGVSMRDQAAAKIAECTFVNNRYSGVGCLDRQDGGRVRVSRSVFYGNGMRPLYRGPLHIDPLVPTPVRIQGSTVICEADPHAEIELYADRIGEASRYMRTIQADGQGRFTVDSGELAEGWVMTASATVDGTTSEFNVVAGAPASRMMSALLGRTGLFSDAGGRVQYESLLRRWRPQTHLLFHMSSSPSTKVERYARFFVAHVGEWTAGATRASLHIGPLAEPPAGCVVIPLKYVSPTDSELLGRGGVTYMKWDASGFFVHPMEILLARGADPKETCPRVLAHEMGHALGLCHARVGLLSRMQGSKAPARGFINDFSPTMTYYDVLALHILHDAANPDGTTLQDLADRGLLPEDGHRELAGLDEPREQPSFSPTPEQAGAALPESSVRP